MYNANPAFKESNFKRQLMSVKDQFPQTTVKVICDFPALCYRLIHVL